MTIQKLRLNVLTLGEAREMADEIERLRAALDSITKFAYEAATTDEQPSQPDWRDFARAQAETAYKARSVI